MPDHQQAKLSIPTKHLLVHLKGSQSQTSSSDTVYLPCQHMNLVLSHNVRVEYQINELPILNNVYNNDNRLVKKSFAEYPKEQLFFISVIVFPNKRNLG